jgi:hypothetical protein
MRVTDSTPVSTSIWSPVYVVGHYRFQLSADHRLTSHEAIADAARWMHAHGAELSTDEVNKIAAVDEYAQYPLSL